MNGASGRYEGSMVNVVGTVIGRVSAVAGSTVVASTIPGGILPTTEPMPGILSAAPKLPLPEAFAPSVKVQAGQPNKVARAPGPRQKVTAEVPTNGNRTKGWL